MRFLDVKINTLLTVLLVMVAVYLFKFFTYYRRRNDKLSSRMKVAMLIVHITTSLVAGFFIAEQKGFDSFPFLEDSFYEEPAAVILWFNIFLLPLGLLIDMLFKSPKLSDELDDDEDDEDF